MKVVGFNGSGSRDGNTVLLLRRVFRELEAAGIETELVHMAGETVHECKVCRACFERRDGKCCQEGDRANEWMERAFQADGIILGSPVYHATITPWLKNFMDRCGTVGRANGGLLRRKVGAGIVAARRAGGMLALDAINHFFASKEMIVPGATYWNIGIGREHGDVERDEEGMQTMASLGQTMAWLVGKLAR